MKCHKLQVFYKLSFGVNNTYLMSVHQSNQGRSQMNKILDPDDQE